MSILTAPRPATKPSYTPPVLPVGPNHHWTAFNPSTLTFGSRVTLRDFPGVHKIVREAEMGLGGKFSIRVREQAEDGSLIGPVRHVRPDGVTAFVTDEPKAGPTVEAVQAEAPALPVEHIEMAAPVDTFGPAWFDASRVVASGDACWLPPTSLIGAIVQRDAIKHELARMGATLDNGQLAKQAPAEIRLVDDDGTPLETPAEMSARDRSEHMARVQALLEGNWFLALNPFKSLSLDHFVDVDNLIPAPCCPDDEPLPCSACLNAPPADEPITRQPHDADALEDDADHLANELERACEEGWFDEAYGEAPLAYADGEVFRAVAEGRAEIMREFGYVPTPGYDTREDAEFLVTDLAIYHGWAEPMDRATAEAHRARRAALLEADDDAADATLELDLADQIEDVVDAYRSNGTAFGGWLAVKLTELVGQARFMGATTPAAFDDRLDAMRDAEAIRAEARRQAACC